jgi:coenzyme F420-dependent glucose-6-phosphate dehydrogenase
MRPNLVIGLHCSHEQHPPSALLDHVRLAADAGFTAAMCSDHFHPWSERQGHSGFAWSWLRAALAHTSLSFGTVCAPGQRYHPAVTPSVAAALLGQPHVLLSARQAETVDALKAHCPGFTTSAV